MPGSSRRGRALKVRVEGQLTFNNLALRLKAALAGCGLAYLPEDQVRTHISDGRLVRVLADWCPKFSGYHLYYPSRRQTTRLSACSWMRCVIEDRSLQQMVCPLSTAGVCLLLALSGHSRHCNNLSVIGQERTVERTCRQRVLEVHALTSTLTTLDTTPGVVPFPLPNTANDGHFRTCSRGLSAPTQSDFLFCFTLFRKLDARYRCETLNRLSRRLSSLLPEPTQGRTRSITRSAPALRRSFIR